MPLNWIQLSKKTFDFLFNDTAVTLWKFVIWKPIKLIYINSTTKASSGRCCTLGYDLRDVEQIYFRTWKVRCIVTEILFLTNLKRKRRVVSVIIRVLWLRKWSFWQHFFSFFTFLRDYPKCLLFGKVNSRKILVYAQKRYGFFFDAWFSKRMNDWVKNYRRVGG